MSKISSPPKSPKRLLAGTRPGAALAAAMVVALAPLAAGASGAPTVKSATVGGFPGVLINHSSRSLYLLTAEVGGKLKCTGMCLGTWFPLTVKKTVTSITVGAGVKGMIGFVARGKSKQVTFNSYPIYTYQGDSGPRQDNGQGITADGGTWYLVKAGATTPATSAVKSSAGGSSGY